MILPIAVVLTGLSAGFFYAWSVSVIPGNRHITDMNYLQSMQSINRAILNPAFFLVFFGSMVALGLAGFLEFSGNKWVFALVLLAFLTYLFGTFGVTGMGNVPLNNELDVLNLKEMSVQGLAEFRKYYEANWNRLHLIRSVFSVTAFVLSVMALLLESKKF